MANPIISELNKELEVLKGQLNKFTETVNYLNEAKNNVTNAVDSLNNSEQFFNKKVVELKDTYDSFKSLFETINSLIKKLDSVNFPDRLDNIETNIESTLVILNETKESTLVELRNASEVIVNVDFEGKFNDLQAIINKAVNSNIEIANSIKDEKISQKIHEFELSINKRIHESLKDVQRNNEDNFNKTSKSILDLNIPLRIDKLDLNIAAIINSIQTIHGRVDLFESNFNNNFRDITDGQKTTTTITSNNQKKQNIINWVIIILLSINLFITVYK